jgi:hypothetical protein
MNPVVATLLTQVASLLSGAVGGAIGGITTLIKGAARELMAFHNEGIAFARDMGMSLNQAQAYTTALTRDTAKLAQQYGITKEAIIGIQRGLSEATSRQLMLNTSQREGFVQLNKLAGDASVNKFAEEMMNGMGAQIDTVQGAVAKAYATASKSGLNAKKVTADIANNLRMANSLSFRNGIDGLTRMAMQAQKVGMSLSSVESVAKTFMDFEGAIEHSAQLQMLGGAAGAFGGNPLDMMYEANNDPEALQKRMTKMLGGYATFDAKTGMANVGSVNMDYLRNIAKALGMDPDEAVKTAKKNAELAYKQQKFGGTFGNYSTEDQDFIMNKSHVRDGRLYINDASGKEHDITNGSIPPEVLEELKQFEGMSDREIMEKEAKTLTSIEEKIAGFWESAKALFAEQFADYIPKIQNLISEYGPKIVKEIPAMAKAAKELVTDIHNMFKELKPYLGWIKDGLSVMFGFIREHWKATLGVLGAIKAAKAVSKIAKFGKSVLGGARGAAFAKNVGKVAKVGGAAIGVGIGAYNAYDAYQKGDNKGVGAGLGTAYGSVIGTMVAGPIGAAVGGFLGDYLGGLIGENWDSSPILRAIVQFFMPWIYVIRHWDDITQWFSDAWDSIVKLWNSTGEWLGRAWDSVVNGYNATIDWFKGAWGTVMDYYNGVVDWFKGAWGKVTSVWDSVANFVKGVFDGFVSIIDWIKEKVGAAIDIVEAPAKAAKRVVEDPVGAAKDAWSTVKGWFGYAEGGLVPGTGTGDTVPAMLTPGEYVIPKEDVIKAKPVGRNDFTFKPVSSETTKVGDSTVTVKDFNININGSLRLDGGMNSARIDINELLRDPQFVSQLKEVITDAISASYHGGRKLNDVPTMRGLLTKSTL